MIECKHCRAGYIQTDWSRLALVGRLEPREVARNTIGWPVDMCIEVRVCSRCGHTIATRRCWSSDR